MRGSTGDHSRTTSSGRVVTVRRSSRRTRTVSAFWEAGTAVVAIPASFGAGQEKEWVEKMVLKLERQRESPGRARNRTSNPELERRAQELSSRFLGERAVPSSVRWVANQNSRWGSCTPSDGSIRLSDKLQMMPGWVVDYVLLHELAHLLVSAHDAAFWALLTTYPDTERAKAFLEGVALARAHGLASEPN
ncbi:M48 family metallopeptidase [Pseudarthrobacter sp. PS3-L1]|uniref:M48 metallopeptidase family protein n=1 Tax=Pseudarthrobacter sp. PS3-L1 TaxID=3046207 RepID=UPI0024B90ED7|nr:M48 family metallopeptidase [Pseudarthrobacter sp. PS3-L1]MDJ0321453.1 M48 family metallopeptidase [Pseudarthrobacter sp. PS3-L1]